MGLILIETLVLCLVFTIFAYCLSLNPIKTLYNYPPKIREKVSKMKEYKDKIPTIENKIIVKMVASMVIVTVVSLILRYLNGITTFKEALCISFFIWTIVNIYDALVIDIIWFCHSKKVRIKGTEKMDEEYKDYMFHIKESIKGEIIGAIVCIVIALIIQFLL